MSFIVKIPDIYDSFSAYWQNGIVGHIVSYVAMYMIKHINTIKLTWPVNDISNCGQAYVTICLIIIVIYNLTLGYIVTQYMSMLEVSRRDHPLSGSPDNDDPRKNFDSEYLYNR